MPRVNVRKSRVPKKEPTDAENRANVAAARKEVNSRMRKLKHEVGRKISRAEAKGNSPTLSMKFRKERTKALSQAANKWNVSKSEITKGGGVINPSEEYSIRQKDMTGTPNWGR